MNCICIKVVQRPRGGIQLNNFERETLYQIIIAQQSAKEQYIQL